MYKFEEFDGTPGKGTFYTEDLQKVMVDDKMLWRVEKVLKPRRGQMLVHGKVGRPHTTVGSKHHEYLRDRTLVRLSPKGKHRFPSVHRSKALLDGVDIWMGEHVDKTPCAVLYGKPGWRSGHQSRLPPLLQMLYVD